MIEGYYHGADNVYEWLEAQTRDNDFELNMSRKHRDGEGVEREPIHLMAMYTIKEPDDSIIENAANIIAKGLHCSVSLGRIDYIKGDEYAYRSASVIHP